MKKRMWVASPFSYLLVLFMYIMAFISFSYDKTLFLIELCIAVIFTLSLAFIYLRFKVHTRTAIKSARTVLMAENQQALNEFALPVLVAGLNGDIIWANKNFETDFNFEKSVLGEDVLKYIYPKTLRQLMGENGSNIKRKNKSYTVYAVKTGASYVLYFVDDTYYKEIHKEYTEKKTVIALISFDNSEEIIRDASGGEESRIISEVETAIRNWAYTLGALFRKMSNGRYLLIAEEVQIDKAKEKRFDVLDAVRKVKNDYDLSATISIGIGRGASSVPESERWARQALDMALGRGGDQVAIMKKGGTFEFFGGLSKGVEKRDKVRTRVIAATLTDYIKSADKVYIMGHKYSDLDSVGSAIGMWAACVKGIKKDAYIVINENQSLATVLVHSLEQAYPDTKIFISPNEAMQDATKKTLVIVVDTHSQGIVESADLLKSVGSVVIIDHHRMMVDHIKNSVVFYHEPYASSACEMVAELIQYIDSTCINAVEAQSILAGIMLDTKNFVLKTGVRTFEAAAFLRRRGADTVQVKKYFAGSINTYKEKSDIVASAEVYKNCAIAAFDGTPTNNTRVSAAQAADELLSIQGVKASFVMFENNGIINISGRSLGEINVQVILEVFGGGGHLTMAGAQIKGVTLREARRSIIEILNDKLEIDEDKI
ncbi:MAG: DHH family phosphoesterase [Clostridia bacterium]